MEMSEREFHTTVTRRAGVREGNISTPLVTVLLGTLSAVLFVAGALSLISGMGVTLTSPFHPNPTDETPIFVGTAGASVAFSGDPLVGQVRHLTSKPDVPVVKIRIQHPGEVVATECSGAVLSDSVVITAAHCVEDEFDRMQVFPQQYTNADGEVEHPYGVCEGTQVFVPVWASGDSSATDVALVEYSPCVIPGLFRDTTVEHLTAHTGRVTLMAGDSTHPTDTLLSYGYPQTDDTGTATRTEQLWELATHPVTDSSTTTVVQPDPPPGGGCAPFVWEGVLTPGASGGPVFMTQSVNLPWSGYPVMSLTSHQVVLHHTATSTTSPATAGPCWTSEHISNLTAILTDPHQEHNSLFVTKVPTKAE